jgi:hypothetical protein
VEEKGKTKSKNAYALREKAHLQYAGKAPAVREAEQSREDDRYYTNKKRQHDGEPFPSFLPAAAALITNT